MPQRIPLLNHIPVDLEKAISLRLKPGEYHHLEELKSVQRFFYNSFDFERFSDELVKFIDKDIDTRAGMPLSIRNLQDLDGFVKKYFTGKLIESEMWIVRAFIIGKTIEQAERIPPKPRINVEKLPASVKQAAREFKLTLRETKALEWTVSHGSQHLSNATNDTTNRVRSIVFDNLKQNKGWRQLRKDLEDEFFNDEKELNRNWKRVAISETNAAFNQGYLAQLKPGEWVMGFSLPDACDFCAKYIDGKVYPVIDPGTKSMDYSHLNRDSPEYKRLSWLWENAVWQNKDNFGRSFAKRKRAIKEDGNVEDNLVERGHHELWRPSIPAHPHCPCRWIRIDVNLQYVNEKGKMRMRVMDEEAWKGWQESVVTPTRVELGRHGEGVFAA